MTLQEIHGTCRYAEAIKISRKLEKGERHVVGGRYWCSYWGFTYEVIATDGWLVTVRSLVSGETWSHSTALDWRRDRMLTS